MKIAIGLGSNLGDRADNLRIAVELIGEFVSNVIVSKNYETPALLPDDAPKYWDISFLNAALIGETNLSAIDLLKELQKIELKLGRKKLGVWSPRTIDLDILFYGNEVIDNADLQVPHPHMLQREFVMMPLREIAPNWLHPRMADVKIMGIVNVTPDSFSDNNSPDEAISHAKNLISDGASLLDIGAESTRPNAQYVSPQEEWERLQPVLSALRGKVMISVDTRHLQTVQKSLELGVDIINDVSAASNEGLIVAVAAHETVKYVLMHSLSVPADLSKTVPDNIDVVHEVMGFAKNKIAWLEQKGIDKSRIIFDVGVGFGKTAEQSLELIERIEEFNELGVSLLVGHSRKSFLSLFTDASASQRDELTLKFSEKLAVSGVEYLRVHNVRMHNGF